MTSLTKLAGAAVWVACTCPLFAQSVRLTDNLNAPVVKPWQALPTQSRNLVELVLPAAKPDLPELARVAITIETRADHAGALHRLPEIAAERAGQTRRILNAELR